MSRAESLRIQADYTDAEIDPGSAADAVAQAETFVQTVERVFGLEGQYTEVGFEDHNPDHDDKISEPGKAAEQSQTNDACLQPSSLEEIRRQARENWLKYRQQKIEGAKDTGQSEGGEGDAKEDQSRSFDADFDQ